jgi:predicted glycosyltransferase
MRVWIDFANSPHVPLFGPVIDRLQSDGDDVLLTARDHAQTVELALERWPDVSVIGGASPGGKVAKGLGILRRAEALRRFARRIRPDVALSHGSYAQVTAARAARVPAVTMMDYEHQPANHLSFRLAQRVIVPDVFPEEALRRFGARQDKVVRYQGFKEELYLCAFSPDRAVLDELALDPEQVVVVLRPPPEGALYHRMVNPRFDQMVSLALEQDDVQMVLLARSDAQRKRYSALSSRIRIPERAIDGRSLLAQADVTIGAGGTMSRESALLGTPTYTVFAGELAAVDAELMRRGLLQDLRDVESVALFQKKRTSERPPVNGSEAILETVIGTLRDVAKQGRHSWRQSQSGRRPS